MGVNVLIFTCVSGRLFQRAIGAYQVAGFLRQHGYSVQVVDFTDNFTEQELKKAVDLYVDETTLAVGVSTTFYSHLENKFIAAKKTFDAIIPQELENAIVYSKEKFPKVKIVFGGSRSLAGEAMPWVDMVIHGYGEDKFLTYLDGLSGRAPKIFSIGKPLRVIMDDPPKKRFDIQELSHQFAPQDFVLPGETLPIEISRGCIFKCKFCAYPLNGKKKMDFLRSAQCVQEELLHNYEKYGTTSYFIGDDTFNDSTFKLEALHKVITELPFKPKFTCYLRLDLLYAHREQIQLLDEMGLASPFFGIESLNQKSATSIGKGMKTGKVKDFLLELYHDHWRGEKPFTCSFIVGLPHETRETVQETFEWVKKTELSSTFFPLSISIKSFYQSEFNRNYKDYGYDLKDPETGYWESENFTLDSATEIAEQFNKELMYTNDRPSSWFLMTMLNHGMTLEEARKVLVKDLPWPKILRTKRDKVAEYKKLVLQS
jgi:radical SAM superfamily enzyme YgiQ (UPF0313 family)